MPDKTTKVLFVALSGIGNYLMQSPTIAALKKAHPDWHITVWVAPRGTRPLAENDPNVDAVIEAPIKGSLSQHLQNILRLRKEKFDIGIILSPGQLIKSAGYLFAAGINQRISHTYPFRGNPESSFLLTASVREDEAFHDIEQNLKLLELLDINVSQPQTYSLSIRSDVLSKADEIFSIFNIDSNKTIVGLHPGSAPDFLWKRWPLERFAEVAKKLILTKNAHILIFGGPDESAQKEELAKLIGSSCTIVSASLLETAALMKKCAYLISNDSGLMHLASASGTKVYGLFGPTDENKTGPRGSNATVIRAEGTKPVYDTEKNYNVGSTPHETILALTPQMVLDNIA